MRASSPTAPVDVALLFDGPDSFRGGGIAHWVHELIESSPGTTFSLLVLGGRRTGERSAEPALPRNVVHCERRYLFEARRGEAGPRFFDDLRAFQHFDALLDPRRAAGLDRDAARRIALALGEPAVASSTFLHGDAAWESMSAAYRREGGDLSFTDYFWTMRAMHVAMFALTELAANLPPAKFHHALSTGYAGFLGALLAHRRGGPLIVTDDGVYTRERLVDLACADAFPAEGARAKSLDGARRLWTRFFAALRRFAYASADSVVALYGESGREQIEHGADPARARVIPTGIDVERFVALRAKGGEATPIIGLVGPVVPAKDVKTFIRAMKVVTSRRPDAQGWIAGSTSDDPAYAAECLQLVASLDLQRKVRFLGVRPAEEVLHSLGLLMLTSASEALPLAVLEAFAAGVPVVATDTGACRELIEGRTGDDRSPGAAGVVVPVADAEGAARAALALLDDPARWSAAREAAIRRVEASYSRARMLDAYRQLYEETAARAIKDAAS
jgi:polysaccharide biosynthesis protein PelF